MARELRYGALGSQVLADLRQIPELAGVSVAAPSAGPCADTYLDTSVDTPVDTYLDTPGRALRRAGYACRLRDDDGNWRATLQALGRAEGAVHGREEIEGPASGSRDATTWPAGPVRDRVLERIGETRLDTLFTLRKTRVKRALGPADAPFAELSLCEIRIDRNGETETCFEVEVQELAGRAVEPGGVTAQLERIGAALEAMGLEVQPLSNYERALALGRSKRPGVVAEDPLAEAARKAIGLHAARLFEQEAGALRRDVEAVHAMRVSIRRMRAALRLFGVAFKRKTLRTLGDGLRTTARMLGAVRDLDVLLAHARETDEAGLATLLAEWETQRAAAHAELAEYLVGRDYAAFAEQLGAFAGTLGAGSARGANAPDQRLRYVAGEFVWRRYQAVRAYDPFVRWAPLETLHALRIDVKYLRYTLEFLREVLGPETPGLIATLVALQDHLGELHDADVTVCLLRTHLGQHEDPDRRISGYLLARERELRRLQRSAPRAWARTASVTFRRRLARAIAAL